MRLHIGNYKEGSLGIKATVGLLTDEGREIYRSEVKLWHGPSRKQFIKAGITAANGNLNDHQRAGFEKQWDEQLRAEESSIHQKIRREKLESAKAPETTPKGANPRRKGECDWPSETAIIAVRYRRFSLSVRTCR
jgi:hypothetical protein